jgi:hypothetical protein
VTDKTSLKFHVVIHWFISSKTLYQHGSKYQLLCDYDQSLHGTHTSVTRTHLQLGQHKMFSHQKQKVVLCLAVHEKKSAML